MASFLLDCNHLSESIQRVSRLRDQIQQARKQGEIFGTCIPVLCELEAGVQQTANPPEYRRRLTLLNFVSLWPLDERTAQTYGSVFNELRRQGRVLSQVDMILAALARQGKLTVLTSDNDFVALPDIKTEDWLA